MNNKRRKRLDEAKALVEQAIAIVEDVRTEEEEMYDNLPDPIRDSSRGDTMQECIDSLGEALDNLDYAVESIENALS